MPSLLLAIRAIDAAPLRGAKESARGAYTDMRAQTH